MSTFNRIDNAASLQVPSPEESLAGRSEAIMVPGEHYVSHHPIAVPFPETMQLATFGLGCFWGAERKFWQCEGVFSTAVGYSAGYTPNPTYEEVCSGMTGHNEVVLVVFDPAIVSYQQLLSLFWQAHNPTQGMSQGNDRGTQYRSGIYYRSDEQKNLAQASLKNYQSALLDAGFNKITTEVIPVTTFYYAEDYHQQYLAKNPGGYCGLGGTGVSC